VAPRTFELDHHNFPDILHLVETEEGLNLFRVEGDENNELGLFAVCVLCDIPDQLSTMAESASGKPVCHDCLQDLMGSVSDKRRARSKARIDALKTQQLYLLENPTSVTVLVRQQVLIRDEYRCRYCGRFDAHLSIDHMMPQSRGGSHKIENLVTACRSCNSSKGARTPEEAGMPVLPIEVTA